MYKAEAAAGAAVQSLLPPELDTLTLYEGGLPNIKGGLPLFRPFEYT